MERKDFLKNGLGFLGIGVVLNACKKDAAEGAANIVKSGTDAASSCIVMPTEEEGPFPYPGGELTNPLNRVDITGGQTGQAIHYMFTVVDTNNNCTVVNNARVDIWHCNKDGYYSGYANQPGYLGTKSYTGETWLRGYRLSDVNGIVRFNSIYPGWYGGRATHVHLEVYVNGMLKKIGQLAFDESVTAKVYATSLYAAHGTNPLTNSSDHVFGNSATDLANEMVSLAYHKKKNLYIGTYTLGVAL